tara:strand:+ start:963 stop:1592 length:630 start_codon:yes stop_codon:yes gene_type:complete
VVVGFEKETEMSVLTIAITQIQDLNGFVNAANEFGNDRMREMGCKHTQTAKVIMGGEAAGLVAVSFEWDSVDAALAGSNAINSDSQMLQMMGDNGVSVVRRSVLEIMGEQGDRTGEFNTCLYMSGNATSEGIEKGWEHMKAGATGMAVARGIALGISPWTGAIFCWTNSVDALLAASVNAFSDPDQQAVMAKNNAQPVGRIITQVLTSN